MPDFFFLNLLYIVFVWVDSDYFNICTYRQVNNILLKVRSHVSKCLATRRGLIYFDQINDENIPRIYILSVEMDELVADLTVAINLCSINEFNLH